MASFAELVPGFSAQERLGIIVREPLQAIWASGLILSAVTAFYDLQRKSGTDFFIYPDYFIFGIDCVPGEYAMLDIWPGHKRITVAPSAEACVRAINDRGVTVLLLPEHPTREPELERQTRSSALNRLKCGLVQCADGDIQVTCPPVVEGYVETVIRQTAGLTDAERDNWCHRRQIASKREHYRRVTPASALTYL